MSDGLDKEVALLTAELGHFRERLRAIGATVDAHVHTIAQIPRLQDDAAAAMARTSRIDVIEEQVTNLGKDIAGIKSTVDTIQKTVDKLRDTASKATNEVSKWEHAGGVLVKVGPWAITAMALLEALKV